MRAARRRSRAALAALAAQVALVALSVLVLAGVPAGGASAAGGIQISIPTGITGTVGDTIDVPVETTDLTGVGIYAYELDLTFQGSPLALIDVIEAGTLTASWGDATFNAGSGTVRLAAAGSSALSGAGVLVMLRFELGPSAGASAFTFTRFVFNEGSPAATTQSGSISVQAQPAISISPNAGELLPGSMLQFFVAGGTSPYTWGTTDPSVATVDAAGLLSAVAAGSCRVFVEDADGLTDATTSDVLVRAMALSVPDDATAPPGAAFTIPVGVTDLTGLDVHAYELEMTFIAARLEVTGAGAAGTLSDAWGAPEVRIEPGLVFVTGAGDTPLSGSGVLVNIECTVPQGASGSTALDLRAAIFDERFTPLLDDGVFRVDAPPVIAVSPNTATLLVGDTLPFTVSGPAVAPFTWGTTDAGVGTIDVTGLFTGTGGGTCRVFVVDDASATDTTSTINVYDLLVTAPDDSVDVDSTSCVPILVDRDVSPLEIYGFQMNLTFNRAIVRVTDVRSEGTITETWGAPTFNAFEDSVRIAHAGAAPLIGGAGSLLSVCFEAQPGAQIGQTSPLTIARLLFNEGDPVPLPDHGSLRIARFTTGVGEGVVPGTAFVLGQNRPNPFGSGTAIPFRVADGSRAGELVLTILDAGGRLVRRYVLHEPAPGAHTLLWDGHDRAGRRAGAGVYFYRLSGAHGALVRKLSVLR